MARASIKKDEAIAIAGKAAAQAAYGALGETTDKPEEGETAVRLKETPKKSDEKESSKPAPDDVDEADEEDDEEGDAAPPATALRSRRPGVGIGRGMNGGIGGNGFPDRDMRPPQGGYRPRSFSGHGGTGGDPDDDGDHEVTQDVLRVLDSIPKDERASVLFKFRQRKTASNGKTLLRPVAELTVAGDPNIAQASIKEELAAIGPGSYDGVPHTTDGKLIRNGTHWAFKITEDEARAAGWRPDNEEEDQMNAQATAPAAVSVVATPFQALTTEDEDVEKAARREKARIELLKHTLDTTKLEIQLQELRQTGTAGAKKPDVKEGVSEEAMKRVVDAEKARLEAETATKLAKAEAEKEKELARIKSEQERELARIKSENEAERRKSEDALRDLKGELGRKEAEHAAKLADIQRNMDTSNRTLQDQFKEQMSKLEATFARDREKEREREKDREREAEKVAAAAAAAAAAAKPQRSPEEIAMSIATAVATAFKPVADIVMAKMNQPVPTPPPAPDPTAQFAAMAKIFSPMIEKANQPPPAPLPPPPPPPPVDVMDIMTKTTDMFVKMMPKQEKTTKGDEIGEAVARALDQRLPALQAPQQAQQPQDPFVFADKLFGYAQNLAAMGGPPEREEREERDDRRDDREEDPFEQAEKTLNRLERFGVKVQIGNQPAQAVEQPKPTAIQEIFAGARAMVPDIGEAVAKYMNSKQPQVDPDILRQVQIQQLKQRTGMRKKTGHPQAPQQPAPQPVAQQQPMQPRPQVVQQRPPQQAVVPHRQQPTGIQRAPQQRPQQQAPVQQRPQQAAQQPNKYSQQPRQPAPVQVPAGPAPYNLPTVMVQRQPKAAPGFVPQEAVPFRPGKEEARQQAANSVPVETIPQEVSQPTVQIQQRPQQVAQPRPAQQRPPQQVAQPRQQQARPQPAQQRPQPQPAPAPAPAAPREEATPQILEALDENGLPTLKSWGELSAYANAAVTRGEDPAVAALHLLEQYPTAAKLVMNVASEMGGVGAIDTMLTNYAAEAGPYADVIGELASKVRNEGKDWATRLILALRGSPA